MKNSSSKNSTLSKALAWALLALWAIVVFLASTRTGADLKAGLDILSVAKLWLAKVLSSLAGHPVEPSPIGHFAEFTVLGALIINVLRHYTDAGRTALGSVALGTACGLLDEIHQFFVPGRDCDLGDLAVDVLAATIAALIYYIATLLRRSGKPPAR